MKQCLLVLLFCLFWKAALLAQSSPEQELARQQGRDLVQGLKDIKKNPDFDLDGLLKAKTQQQKALEQELFGGILNDPVREDKARPTFDPSSGERIMVALSSSVPPATIQNYLYTLETLDDPRVSVVIRGFVGGNHVETLRWIERVTQRPLVCQEKDCKPFQANVALDPPVFQALGIDRVPALIHLVGPVLDPKGTPPKAMVIWGDVSLIWALEQYANSGQAPLAVELLNKWSKKGKP